MIAEFGPAYAIVATRSAARSSRHGAVVAEKYQGGVGPD